MTKLMKISKLPKNIIFPWSYHCREPREIKQSPRFLVNQFKIRKKNKKVSESSLYISKVFLRTIESKRNQKIFICILSMMYLLSIIRMSPKNMATSKLLNYTSITITAFRKISRFSFEEVKLTKVLNIVLWSKMAAYIRYTATNTLATVQIANEYYILKI